MHEKTDKLVSDYKKIHNRFTQLRNKGKNPNLILYSEKLWDLQDKGLKYYES